MIETALLIAVSYLWGAVPTTYLAGRYRMGIDLRQYGSGNVGAANFMAHVGKKTGFILGAFDCLAKGSAPLLIARLLDQGAGVQMGMGLAAIAGHNWSPYLRFTGGRGVATAVGVVLGALMWPEFLILTVVMGGLGYLIFKESGFWTFISLLILPVLAFLFGREPEIFYMTIGIGALLIGKRLTSNWESPAAGISLIRVMVYRALWDRDVPRKGQWTQRGPMTGEDSLSRDVGDHVLR